MPNCAPAVGFDAGRIGPTPAVGTTSARRRRRKYLGGGLAPLYHIGIFLVAVNLIPLKGYDMNKEQGLEIGYAAASADLAQVKALLTA